VEVFLPSTGQICTLDWLWGEWTGSSLNVIPSTQEIVLCGGRTYHQTTCMKWTPNRWKTLDDRLKAGRVFHTALAVEDKLLLIGGDDGSATSTEVLGEDLSYEILKQRHSCSIQDPKRNSVIITGGTNGSAFISTVNRYGMEGLIESLPELLTGRREHGCGSYFSNEGTVLLVAGGIDKSVRWLDSTEILLPGAQGWIETTPLPKAMRNPTSASSTGRVFMIGGNVQMVDWITEKKSFKTSDEILAFDGEKWDVVAKMAIAREDGAATQVMQSMVEHCTRIDL